MTRTDSLLAYGPILGMVALCLSGCAKDGLLLVLLRDRMEKL